MNRTSSSIRCIAVSLGFLLMAHESPAGDLWDIDDNQIGFAIADAQWTIAKQFPGTKLIVDGTYLFNRREIPIPTRANCDCTPAGTRDRIAGSIWGHAQWGSGDTQLEYGLVALNMLAFQTDYELSEHRFQPISDTQEWGVVRFSKDDPLGIDSYTEVSIFETSRIWRYRQSEASPWFVDVGVNLSVGHAWAQSTDDTYQDVANPIIGSWMRGTFGRRGWGSVYIEQRVINGFTFSSPARGGAVSREATARFGYRQRLRGCFDLEVFAEKRSFNFSDPLLPDLYTKSKRTGVAMSCRL